MAMKKKIGKLLKIPKKNIPVYSVKVKLDKSWMGKKSDTFESTHPKRYKKGKKMQWEHGITATVVSVTQTKKKTRFQYAM